MTCLVHALSDLPFDTALRVDETCDLFETAIRTGGHPRIEDFLAETPAGLQATLFRELLQIELQFRIGIGHTVALADFDYSDRFPHYREVIDVVYHLLRLKPAAGIQDSIAVVRSPLKAASVSGDPAQELTLPFQLGEYRLDARIGHGGMGTVYRAVHQKLDRPAAVKLMLRERMRSPNSISRFQREMRAVAKLNHPNIVMAYDAGESDGQHFLVMEYVPGWDLASVCQCFGTLPVPVACECIRQAARGLQQLVAHGLVHRDIKPSNLMLTRDGVVKLLDLGLAGLREDGPDERITRDSGLMGTIEYMAPEQASQPHGVDIRADIYSLGCTLFRLLCGFSPFGRPPHNTMQLIIAHKEISPPRIRDFRPEVPLAVEELVNRMLEKRLESRPQSPDEVIRALKPFASAGLLKSFATAVGGISDPEGRLPKEAPPGVRTGTESWQPPAPELSPQEIVVPTQLEPQPDAGQLSPYAQRPLAIPRNTRSIPRRTWLMLAGTTVLGFVGAMYWNRLAGHRIDLLRGLQAESPLRLGRWHVSREELTSPETGPGFICLTQEMPSDYRLEFTVKPIAGKLRWSILSTADPEFAIDFGVATIPDEESTSDTSTAESAAAQSISGNWGDPADFSARLYHLRVEDHRLTLIREGERDPQLKIDLADRGPTHSEWLSPEAREAKGLFLVTEDTTLEFRRFILTPSGIR